MVHFASVAPENLKDFLPVSYIHCPFSTSLHSPLTLYIFTIVIQVKIALKDLYRISSPVTADVS